MQTFVRTLIALCSILLSSSSILASAKDLSQSQREQRQQDNSILPVRALRTPRQSVQFENDFVITFSGDGTPIQLPPISLLLDSITGDLSNNGRVILGRAFADFLNDELTKEWEDDTEMADLTSVLVDVIKIETVAATPDNLKEIEATLDTTLTFDGLANAPDPSEVIVAVFKVLGKMPKFVNNYLKPAGLDEFESVQTAKATMETANTAVVTKPPKKEEKPPKKDKKPVVAKANAFRSVSFDAKDLEILIPSLVGGVALFVLTALFLRRRGSNKDMNLSYDSDDIDHTINGSRMGKEEIEVQPSNLMHYDGYHPDGHVDLNSSYGAGHVAMHIPAMDQSTMSQKNHRTTTSTTNPNKVRGRSVIDSPSRAESSAVTSEYSEGRYWR